MPGQCEVHGGKWRDDAGVLEIELRKGEEALVHPKGTSPDTRVGPVEAPAAPPWGLPGASPTLSG